MMVPQGDTYYVKFTTRSFSTGAPTQLAGTPVISVYEEANLTQITAGVTLTVDYDGVTGLNDVAIVATSGNGYEIGKYYSVVITTGTVGGVSVVGEVVGHFRCMPAEDAGAGIPDVNLTNISDAAVSASTAQLGVNVVQAAGTAWASGAITAASIAANAIGASELAADAVAEIADAVWDELQSGHVAAGSFGEIATEIANILVDTNELQTNQGNWLTATGFSTHSAADVWSVATRVLTANTNLNDPTAAAIADAVWDEALSGHLGAGSTGEALNAAGAAGDPWTTTLPGSYTGSQAGAILNDILTDTGTTLPATLSTIAGYIDTEVAAIKAVTDALPDSGALSTITTHLTDIKGATFSGATDSLEAIRDRGDAAWVTGAGGSAPTAADIRAEIDANSTQLAAIVADTSELQTDWVNGGRLDLILDARASQVSVDTVDSNVDAVLVDTGTTLPATLATIAGYIDTEVAAIKAVTDALPDAGALTSLATAAALATVDSNVDAILVDTGTTLEAHLTDIKGATFSGATDSLEAIRNRGDSAWITATGFSTLTSGDVNAACDTALADYDAPTKAELDSGLAALNDLSAAEINAEVVDALSTDTYAEPGQGAPGATISLAAKIGYLYKAWRNRSTQDATDYKVYADNGTTVDHKSTVSDDTTTADKGKIISGP